jgi:hypothetical protein
MTTTSHLQKIPDFYIDKYPNIRESINNNERYKHFTQIHFTVGDVQQFTQYRDFSNDKMKKIALPKIKDWKIENINWELYKNLEKRYIDTTFRYLFDKFKKSIFIKIHNNELKVFLPFSKVNYNNEWHTLIKQDPKYDSIGDFLKFCSKLQGFDIQDKRINKFICSWYGNNCLFRYEYPPKEENSGMGCVKDMFTELCKHRQLPDIEFFVNKRDFPVIKKNLTEPYESLFGDKNLRLLSHKYQKYYPILSMVTTDVNADIPIPTIEDWARVTNISDKKLFYPPKSYDDNFSRSFKNKKPIAVFRGSSTGEGTEIDTNMRLKVASMSYENRLDKDNLPFLDAGITKWNTRPRKEINKKYISTIDYTKFSFGLVSPLSPKEQSNYKYIINIDGHVSAFRLSLELSMFSVVLLVESKYRIWYRNMLVPYVHYVPVKSDLSDLYEKISWCKENDTKCEEIAGNARKFYDKYLSKDGIFDYLQFLLIKLRSNMGESYYNSYKISELQYAIECNSLKKINNFKEPSVKREIINRGGISISEIDNSTCLKVVDCGNKIKETTHEVFVGYHLNKLKAYIPNFMYVYSHDISHNKVRVIKEWIEGISLENWFKTKFNIGDFNQILLQINLSLFSAQSLYGFIHYDLYPWNVIIKEYDNPVTIYYPYENGKCAKITTKLVPYIIDYGKSSIIKDGIRYGNVKTCSIHDTLTILLSCLYECVKLVEGDDIRKLMRYANFISNTKFRPQTFDRISELRLWLRDKKKYDTLLYCDKYELSSRSSVDFIKYISKNIVLEKRLPPKLEIKDTISFVNNINNLDLNDKFTLYHISKFIDDICDKKLLREDMQNKLLQKIYILDLIDREKLRVNMLSSHYILDLDTGFIQDNIPVQNVDWKTYEINTEIYFPDPKKTFSIYSHSTYLFYCRLITRYNLANKSDFSNIFIEKAKRYIAKNGI